MAESRFRPTPLVLSLIIGGLVAWLLVWPQGFGLQRALVLAQIVASRGALTIVLGAGAIVFVVIAITRRSRGVTAGLAIVLTVAALASGAIMAARGTSSSSASGDLTVVAWNTQGDGVSPASVAHLLAEVDADVASLPETSEAAAQEIARLLAADGHAMTAHTTYGLTGYSDIPTSLLVADRLGEYHVDASAGSTPGLPSGVWRPVDGIGPTIVAAHPFPPFPWRMDVWRAGLVWVAEHCAGPNVIVAGDLNATVDHLEGLGVGGALVGECEDAASAAGAAGIGTWPVPAPTWLASPIDHVLIGSGWQVRSVRVDTSLDGAGSDHRPVIAVLSPT